MKAQKYHVMPNNRSATAYSLEKRYHTHSPLTKQLMSKKKHGFSIVDLIRYWNDLATFSWTWSQSFVWSHCLLFRLSEVNVFSEVNVANCLKWVSDEWCERLAGDETGQLGWLNTYLYLCLHLCICICVFVFVYLYCERLAGDETGQLDWLNTKQLKASQLILIQCDQKQLSQTISLWGA